MVEPPSDCQEHRCTTTNLPPYNDPKMLLKITRFNRILVRTNYPLCMTLEPPVQTS